MDWTVLRCVAQIWNKAGIVWGLGGSGMLYHYGLADRVRDIDLLVAGSDMEEACRVLASMGEMRELPYKLPFCSKWFRNVGIGNADVDVIGIFRYKHGNGIYEWDLAPENITGFHIEDDVRIPLTSLEDWYVMYLLMGRTERSAAIERHLQEKGIGHPELLQAALVRNVPEEVRQQVESLLKSNL